MAYSASKYQLTRLLHDAWLRMGQLKRWKITGGSETTLINTAWAGVEEQIYEDDDPALIYGSAIVIRDSAGNGAAPEGEISRITDYDSSSQTATIDTLSAALAATDIVGIASPLFPFQDMISVANIAMRGLGEIDIPDTSITTAAGQTEYTLPSTIRTKPVAVNRQTILDTDNNQWSPVQGWYVIPATAGSNWTLVVPMNSQGYKLQVVYRGMHPILTAYDSDIIETINPELALCAMVVEAFQWYNNQVGGTNEYFLRRENKALQDLDKARLMFPIQKQVEQVQGMPHWGKLGEYVPGTSDLRA